MMGCVWRPVPHSTLAMIQQGTVNLVSGYEVIHAVNSITIVPPSNVVSSNYVLSLNATTYYANLTSETPLDTAVFYLQLSINLSIVPEMAICDVVLRFNQNQLVQRLFEFEHGDNNVYHAINDLQSNGSQTIVRTSLNLTELPAANEYPVDVDMTITVSLLYMVSNMYFTDDTSARGIASIVMAPG